MRLHNRQVKAAFWEDPKLMRLHRDVRTLFHGLWHLADDSGCLEHDTFAFKTFLFRSPLDDDMSIERLGDLTQQLIGVELLIPYEAARKQCLFVRNFHKHQSLRSPAPPEVPLPPWVIWIPSKEKQRSGTYQVTLPDTDDDGERTESVRKPYGDLTEPKGNQARARNEPEPEPEGEGGGRSHGAQVGVDRTAAPAALPADLISTLQGQVSKRLVLLQIAELHRAYGEKRMRFAGARVAEEKAQRAEAGRDALGNPVARFMAILKASSEEEAEAYFEEQRALSRRTVADDDQDGQPSEEDDESSRRAREQARQLRLAALAESDPRERIRRERAEAMAAGAEGFVVAPGGYTGPRPRDVSEIE